MNEKVVLQRPTVIRKKRSFMKEFLKQADLQILVIPSIIHIIIFLIFPCMGL